MEDLGKLAHVNQRRRAEAAGRGGGLRRRAQGLWIPADGKEQSWMPPWLPFLKRNRRIAKLSRECSNRSL